MTHTFAELQISCAAFDEIKAKFEAAGYDHALLQMDDGITIDMHGVGLTRAKPPDLSRSAGIEPRSSRLARELSESDRVEVTHSESPAGFVTSEDVLTEADRAEVMRKFEDGAIGPGNAGRPVILESGARVVFEARKKSSLDLVEVFPC